MRRTTVALALLATAALALPATGDAKSKRPKTALSIKTKPSDVGKISFSHREFRLKARKKARRSSASAAARKLTIRFRARVKNAGKLPKNLIAVAYVTKIKNTSNRFAADIIVISSRKASASTYAQQSIVTGASGVDTEVTGSTTGINGQALRNLPITGRSLDILDLVPGVAADASKRAKVCGKDNGFATEQDGKTFVTQTLGKQIDKLDGGVELTLRDLARAAVCTPEEVGGFSSVGTRLGFDVVDANKPALQSCTASISPFAADEIITKMSCIKGGTAIGAQMPNGFQIINSLPPPGAACNVTSVNGPNDYYMCNYNFSAGQQLQYNLRLSPNPTAGFKIKTFSFDGVTRFGPFESAGL